MNIRNKMPKRVQHWASFAWQLTREPSVVSEDAAYKLNKNFLGDYDR